MCVNVSRLQIYSSQFISVSKSHNDQLTYMLATRWSALFFCISPLFFFFFASIILILGFCWTFSSGTFLLLWTFLETSWVTDWTLWPWCFCSFVSTLSNTKCDTLFLWSGSGLCLCWWIHDMVQDLKEPLGGLVTLDQMCFCRFLSCFCISYFSSGETEENNIFFVFVFFPFLKWVPGLGLSNSSRFWKTFRSTEI